MRDMLIKTLGLSLALTLGLVPAAHASDLLQYYHDAITHDANFAAARYSLMAGREKEPQGLSELLPQITATGTDTYNTTTIVQAPLPIFNLTYPARAFTVQLTQPLFRWANFQEYEQSKLEVAQSEAQFVQAQQDLIVRVAQAYFDVLAAQDAMTFLSAQKSAIAQQLASAKKNFEVGTATVVDSNEAQSRYDLAVAQEIAAQSDLEVKQSALEQIIGQPVGQLAALRAGVQLSAPEPANLEVWVSTSRQQNPSVAQAQALLEIAKRQIEVNRAGHYPTVDLIASRQYGRAPTSVLPPELGVTTQNAIGIQVSVPIYSGGMISSKVREAVALEDKAQSELEAARRRVAQNARQAYVGVTSGLARVHALEAAERSSKSSLESNKVGYQLGIRINIDVLNAQQQLFSTQRDLARARYDTLLDSLKLKSAAGTLKEADLQMMNALLQH